jgi:hypothetical protein
MADDPAHGWSDIGYNGLICPHARAIEGRGIDYAGAHCPDHNRLAYGWQFMLGKGEVATPAMQARMRKAYDDCCTHSKRTLAKRGHRDGFATECPGDQIYAWVKAGMPATAPAQPTPKEWWEMPIPQADLDAIATRVWNHPGLVAGRSIWGEVVTACNRSQATADALKALAETLPADAAKAVLASLDASYEADITLKPKGS